MEKFNNRKKLRLEKYDYKSYGAYFITICTEDKKHILGKIVGGDAYIAPYIELSEYGQAVEKYLKNITGIDVYTIMPNHIHMIIRIGIDSDGTMWASSPTQGIPQLIKSFKTLVTKNCGKSIFQRSYYDHIIRDEKDYMEKRNYILTNPSKWAEDEYYSG
ncbi:MAG: hypothetical protein IJ362_07905 [Oscillospiraceae bacterium]|nr:hypothetical protein [Oscillospiraceae bacterium]